MGHRNHLHVCQHCGIVHATASTTAPRACVVCDAITFSVYEPADVEREGVEIEVVEPARESSDDLFTVDAED